jgi:excisionase family DNA binding protein
MKHLGKNTALEEQKLADQTLQHFAKTVEAIANMKSTMIHITLHETGELLTMPKSAIDMLYRYLSEVANGEGFSFLPSHSELTTQQAANLLNVSRPHIVKLLEDGKIPFKKVGSHRRVLLEDVVKFRSDLDARRAKHLEALAAQAQALGLGYE